MVVANTFGVFVLLIIFIFGGFVIRRNDIKPWWIWGYWASPMMYSQNAISINEFLASRWAIPNNDTTIDAPTVGKAILKSKGLFTGEWGFWVSIGALIGFIILFSILYLWALTILSPSSWSNTQISEGEDNEHEMVVKGRHKDEISQAVCSDPGAIACSISSFNLLVYSSICTSDYCISVIFFYLVYGFTSWTFPVLFYKLLMPDASHSWIF